MHEVALTRRSDVISDRPTPLAEFEVLLRVHSRWPLSSICYGHMHTHPSSRGTREQNPRQLLRIRTHRHRCLDLRSHRE